MLFRSIYVQISYNKTDSLLGDRLLAFVARLFIGVISVYFLSVPRKGVAHTICNSCKQPYPRLFPLPSNNPLSSTVECCTM